jgi:hypothetical protein
VDVDWITIPWFLRMKKISMDGPINIVKQSGDYFWVLPSGLGLPPQLLWIQVLNPWEAGVCFSHSKIPTGGFQSRYIQVNHVEQRIAI